MWGTDPTATTGREWLAYPSLSLTHLVPSAFAALNRCGTLALAGIYMTPFPQLVYERKIFYERNLRSVTANGRQDGRDLLSEAVAISIRTPGHLISARAGPRRATPRPRPSTRLAATDENGASPELVDDRLDLRAVRRRTGLLLYRHHIFMTQKRQLFSRSHQTISQAAWSRNEDPVAVLAQNGHLQGGGGSLLGAENQLFRA